MTSRMSQEGFQSKQQATLMEIQARKALKKVKKLLKKSKATTSGKKCDIPIVLRQKNHVVNQNFSQNSEN